MKGKRSQVVIYILLFIIIISLLLFLLSKILIYFNLSKTSNNIILSVVVLFVGYFFINYINRKIQGSLNRFIRKREKNLISFIFLIFSYLILIIVVFNILHINITNVLLGGAFLGVIIGIAAQSTLTNLLGGIIILIFRQFDVGEKVKITTWQFSFLLPSYPNKFFSNDLILPGLIGTIDNIGIFYSSFIGDDGIPFKIPNSIMIQAAVQKLDKVKHLRIQIKYEVKKEIPFEKVEKIVEHIINDLNIEHNGYDLYINDTTLLTYIVVLRIQSLNKNEDFVKSKILEKLLKEIK
ncbi:mechanosensitive ion channel family protein [Patescibacteria group bacterium]|nr:mechanosensitive ion channel family protein [Patescibacteria group bacterium]